MKNFITLAVLCLVSFICNGQTTINGNITDNVTNEPLTGVTIIDKATGKGTVSEFDGSYEIQVSDRNATLIFSYIGYSNLEIEVNGISTWNISLNPNSSELNEIIVTALGLKRSSKDIGYAVQQLNSEQVSEVKSANFIDNLNGKIAGVSISQGATGVGSTSKITIRGEASFTNNNPLFVIDGTPINNNSIVNFTNEAAAGFQEVDFGNGGMEINADDVTSVSVLKGPSAAALYGTRASNGVIIITTKDGSHQKGLGISFNSSTFVDRAFQLPEFQNRYGQGNSGQFEFIDGLGGGVNDNITYSWGPELDVGNLTTQFDSPVNLSDGRIVRGGDVAIHGGAPITPTELVSNPDNLKNFYQTGVTTTNNLAIASGFDKGNFRFSYTDFRSESIIPGVDLKRKNLNARLNFNPTKKISVSSTLNYVNSNSKNRPANGYGSENINYSLVAWGPRSLNIENLKDYWQPGLEGVQQFAFNYTFFDNPYFILNENRNSFNRDRLFGNIETNYQITPTLSFKVRSGMDYSSELRQFRRGFSSNRFKNGAYAEHNVFFRENNTDVLLNYKSRVNAITFDFSVGANRMDQKASTKQIQTVQLAQPGIFKLSNAAAPLETFDIDSKKRINSVYGLLKLGYKDFLYLDITGRNDWSSALATPISAENSSFFYPSISTSVVLSNLIQFPESISFAKIRASWAQVGNDTDPFQTAGSFIAQTPFNNQPTFSEQGFISNSNLLPERIKSFEIGTDVRFFDDRLRFDFTYYNTLTKNQIISLPISISSGYTQQVVNGGEVRTKGIELVAGINPIRKKDFSWTTYLNFSTNEAIVESLPQEAGRLTLAYSRVYDNTNQTVWFQVEEGGRIGDIYGTGYLKNENGDFVIDGNGKFIVDNNLIKLGNYNPDFTLGFSNHFDYKNWNASFLLDWKKGGVIVSRTQALAGVGGQLIETENRPEDGIIAEGVINTGTPENPIWTPNSTAVSPESYYRQFYDRNHEENNTYDASYLKLREFSIGYTFGGANKSEGFFSNGRQLKVALIGRNLFAWSDIPHFDPEQLAVQGNNFVSGVEDMSYATSRSFGIKLGLDF